MGEDGVASFEDLEPILLSLELSAVAAFFAGVDEVTRRKLAPAVRKWVKGDNARNMQSMMDRRDEAPNERSPQERNQHVHDLVAEHGRRSDCSTIALLATATGAELKKRSRADVAGLRDTTVVALVDRRPDWCGDYVDHLLAIERESSPITWGAVRALIDAGLIKTPESPGLPDLMVRSRVGADRDSWREPLIGRLRDQWETTESVTWRIFTTPSPSLDGDEWRAAIVAQTETGDMERRRVLDETLAALRRDDFRPKQLRWLLALLEDLHPTDADLGERERALADLLTTDLPAIPASAIKYLTRLGPTTLHDLSLVLHGLSVSVLSKTKATAKSSLTFAGQILAVDESTTDGVLRVAVAGLGHHDAAIRSKAVDLAAACLEGRPGVIDAWRRELSEAVTALPATEVDAAFARLPIDPEVSVVEEDTANSVDLSDVEALPTEERKRWGVDDAVAALDTNAVPPVVRVLSPSLTPLVLGAPVEKIDDLSELVELVGHALENGDDWLSTERCLDGLSRRGAELRSLGKRYDALVRQANRVINRWPSAPSRALARLIVREATGQGLVGRPELAAAGGLEGLTQGRAQEIGYRLRSGISSPLLSTPSHSHGWITPDVLVDRIAAWPEGTPPTECDTLCALLRMHAFGIAEARQKLPTGEENSEVFRAVAFAMGKDVVWPVARPALRAAAEDTRHRTAEPGWCERAASSALEDARKPQQRPSGPRFVRVEGRDLFAEPPESPVVPVETRDVKAIVLGIRTWGEDDQRWAVSAAPGYVELAALPALAASLSYGRVPMAVALEPVLDPDQTVGQVFSLLLAIALTCDDATTQIVAQDSYVVLIDDGRLDVEQTASALASFIAAGRAKTNRVAEGLKIIAGAGDLHGDEICRMLDLVVANLTDAPANAHTLLELSHELHVVYGRTVANERTRSNLEAWSSGSSRRAKAANQLLAVEDRPSPPRQRAAQARVHLRIDRARRAGAVS